MRKRGALSCFALVFCATQALAAHLALRPVADIVLPGNANRLDYQSLDAARHLLFVAHLGDSEVIVVDTYRRRVVGIVRGISSVHGVLAVPELNKVYASATGTDRVVAIDESTLKVVAVVPGGTYPDGIAFDPLNRHLFVSDERGETDTVIDATTNRRIATIPIGGEAGNTQYDSGSRRIYVNDQSNDKLVEIDPETNRIVRRIAVPGCKGSHGLLIDGRNRRAFIGCEDNATFVWLNMRNMRIAREWRIGSVPDVLALDRQARRIYVASESGVVSIFSDAKTVTRIAQGFLAPEAHTVAVDPVTHLLYFPLENINGRPLLRVMRGGTEP